MTNNTLAPMYLLPSDVDAYLDDLDRATKIAQLHLAAVQVEMEVMEHAWRGSAAPSVGLAMNRATDVVRTRHHDAMHTIVRAALDTYRTTVAWYARAATLALEAVLAGGKVTARELEKRTLHRLVPVQPADHWDAPTRPPLPTPDALLTGHDDIDRRVRDAYTPLIAAYHAAEEVAATEEDFEYRQDGYVADWEASAAHDAATRAAKLHELLHAWAAAVAFAAQYGRSRARGHQPAEQGRGDTNR